MREDILKREHNRSRCLRQIDMKYLLTAKWEKKDNIALMSKSEGSSLKFHQYIRGLLSVILGPSQIYTSSPQTVHMVFFMFETLSIIAFLKL